MARYRMGAVWIYNLKIHFWFPDLSDQQWVMDKLESRYPGLEFKLGEDGGNRVHIIQGLSTRLLDVKREEVYYAILNWLGESGWEPFQRGEYKAITSSFSFRLRIDDD